MSVFHIYDWPVVPAKAQSFRLGPGNGDILKLDPNKLSRVDGIFPALHAHHGRLLGAANMCI